MQMTRRVGPGGQGGGVKTRYTATNCINTGVFDVFARYKSRYRVIQELLQCPEIVHKLVENSWRGPYQSYLRFKSW